MSLIYKQYLECWLLERGGFCLNLFRFGSLFSDFSFIGFVNDTYARGTPDSMCYIVIYTFIQHHNDTIIKTHEGRKTQEEL